MGARCTRPGLTAMPAHGRSGWQARQGGPSPPRWPAGSAGRWCLPDGFAGHRVGWTGQGTGGCGRRWWRAAVAWRTRGDQPQQQLGTLASRRATGGSDGAVDCPSGDGGAVLSASQRSFPSSTLLSSRPPQPLYAPPPFAVMCAQFRDCGQAWHGRLPLLLPKNDGRQWRRVAGAVSGESKGQRDAMGGRRRAVGRGARGIFFVAARDDHVQNVFLQEVVFIWLIWRTKRFIYLPPVHYHHLLKPYY
jgi:hypothetical protein